MNNKCGKCGNRLYDGYQVIIEKVERVWEELDTNIRWSKDSKGNEVSVPEVEYGRLDKQEITFKYICMYCENTVDFDEEIYLDYTYNTGLYKVDGKTLTAREVVETIYSSWFDIDYDLFYDLLTLGIDESIEIEGHTVTKVGSKRVMDKYDSIQQHPSYTPTTPLDKQE